MRMRTGKRNWLLMLGAVCVLVFFIGKFSNNSTPEAVAATDTRTVMERYVDAFSLYTNTQLDRFNKYQAAVKQSDWDSFWMMLVRVTLCTMVILVGYWGFRISRVYLDGMSIKASIVTTPYGIYVADHDETGKRVLRPIDKPAEEPVKQKATEALPVFHNGEMESIEVSKEGKVITVVEDAADFLERAIKVNGSHSKELPRHENMGVSGSKWDAMVHDTLGGLFTVDNKGGGVKTYCAQYPDLGTTYFAVINKKVPLPEKKKAKKA